MASAKKGKKSKGKVVSLSEFLSDDHGGSRSGEAVVMAPSKSSWADEMEEEAVYKEKLLLPTAPRAARGSDIDEGKIPNAPPYTAYIANLPYDIEVEDVGKFFHGLSVKSVRLPRDGGEGGRLRGFGYAEFETRQDLVDALTMNELMIKNRKIRVDIASGADGDQEQGPGGAGRGRGRPREEEREDRTPSDWRNAPREGPPPSSERPGFRSERGGDRMDRDNMGGRYDAGFNPRERAPGAGGPPERSSFGARRDGPSSGSSFGRDRDGPSSFGRDRDGPSSFGRDRDGPSSFNRDEMRSRDAPSSFSRDRDGPSSFSRDRDGPSSFSRDRGDRDGPSSFSRDRDGPSSFNRERPSERVAEAPKERPKLALKPRTVPVGEEGVSEPTIEPAVEESPVTVTETPTAQQAPKPNSAAIFGTAKPVDTAAREREIEERLRERQREREAQREPVRGRETDRQEVRNDRDGSRGSGGGGRGRSTEGDGEHDEDSRRRDGPSPNDSRPAREGDYRPPQRAGGGDYRPPRDGDYRPPRTGNDRGGGDYRPPARNQDREYRSPRDGDRDYRPPREGDRDYRPPRGDNRDGDNRYKENGASRGGSAAIGSAGTYRPPNGSSRGGGQNNDRMRSRDNNDADRRPASGAGSSDESNRIRKIEEPKAPVFENRNKFSYLLAEDEGPEESSDGRDEQ